MSTQLKIWIGFATVVAFIAIFAMSLKALLTGIANEQRMSIAAKIGIGLILLILSVPMIADPSATKLIALIGVASMAFAYFWSLRAAGRRRLLGMTLPQIYQQHLQGRVPRRAAWQQALIFGGLALVVLSEWRACSGLK